MNRSSLPSGRKQHLHRGLSALALLAAVAAGSLLASQTSYAATVGQWTLSSVATNGPDNGFKGIDALGNNDVWAVGATNCRTNCLTTGTAPQNTLIEHFDGQRWTITPSPNVAKVVNTYTSQANVLNAVDAISSSNVWAVGYTAISTNLGSQSLVEHWDGRSWTVVPSPNGVSPLFGFYNFLNAVSGTAANDVWAVGWNGAVENQHRATIQHWNGTAWSLVPAPVIGNTSQYVVLTAVTALASNNAWAAGIYRDSVDATISHPVTLHWNGTSWSVVNAADVTLSRTVNHVTFNTLKAVAANDIWAAGNIQYVDPQGSNQSQALIEHWDGTRWSVVDSPNLDGTLNNLTGLAPLAANDIWATGITANSQAGVTDPLVEHWDGTSWTTVGTPRPDKAFNCGFVGAASAAGGAEAIGICVNTDPTATTKVMPFAELFR